MVSFFISLYGLCFKVHFVWYEYCDPLLSCHFHLHEIYFSVSSLCPTVCSLPYSASLFYLYFSCSVTLGETSIYVCSLPYSASLFYLYFSCSVTLGETIITVVLEGYFYMGTSLCSPLGFNIFCCECFQYECLPSLSSVYGGRYPLDRRFDWCCGDQSLLRILSRASSLLSGTGSAP